MRRRARFVRLPAAKRKDGLDAPSGDLKLQDHQQRFIFYSVSPSCLDRQVARKSGWEVVGNELGIDATKQAILHNKLPPTMSARHASATPGRSSTSFFTTPPRFSSVRPSTPTPQSSRNARASSLLPSNASLAAFHGHPLLPHDLSPDQQLEQDRQMSSQRLIDIWENIARKYGDIDPEEDDEVDILTGEIVVNRGKLKYMERVEIGKACDDLFEDLDEDEEESQAAPESSQAEEFELDEDQDVLDVWDNTDIEQRIETNIPDFLKPDLERLDPAVLPKPTPRWSRADDADLKEFLRSEEEKRAKRGEKSIAEEDEEIVKEEKVRNVPRSGSAPADAKSIKSWNVLPSRLRGTIHLPIDLMPEVSGDDDEDDPLSDISSGSAADFGLGKLHLSNSSPTRSVVFASSRMASPSPLLKSALIKSGSPVPSAFKTPRSHGPSPLSRSTLPFQHDSVRTPSSPLNPSAVRQPRMQPLFTSSKKTTETEVAPKLMDADLNADLQDVLKKESQLEKRDRSYRPSYNKVKYEEPESPTMADRPRRVRKRRVQYPEPETMNLVPNTELLDRVVVVPRAGAVEEAITSASPSWKDKEKWRAGSQPFRSNSGPPGRPWSPSDSRFPNGSALTESSASKSVDVVARRDRTRSSIESPDYTEVPVTPNWKTLPEAPVQEEQAENAQSSSNRKDFRSFYLTPTQLPTKSRTSAGNIPVFLKSADGVRRGRGRPFGSCADCDKAGRLTIRVCPGRLSRKKCPFMQKGVSQEILLELMKIAMEVKMPMLSLAQRDLVNGLKPKTEPLDPTAYEAARVRSEGRRSSHEDLEEKKEELWDKHAHDDAAAEEKHPHHEDLFLTDAPSIDVIMDHNKDMDDVLHGYGSPMAVTLPLDGPTTQDRLLTEEDIFPTDEIFPVKVPSPTKARSPSSALSSIPPSYVKDEDVPAAGREEDDDDDVLLLGSSAPIKNEMDVDAAGSSPSTSKRKATATHGFTPPKRVKWNDKAGTPLGWNSPTSFVRGNEVIDVDEWEPVDEDEVDELDEW